MNPVIVLASITFLTLASIYLLARTGIHNIVYSAVIVMFLAQTISFVFSIMHLPGADELMIIGYTGYMTGALLLIWKALPNKIHKFYLNKLLIGLIILLQFSMVFEWIQNADKIGPLLNYPMAALIGTVLVNDQTDNNGEKNMMILYLLQCISYIIFSIMKIT